MEKSNFWVIILLSFMSFAIGISEFAPMGILVDMARDFNRPIQNMGEITSLYAIGAAIGAPVLMYLVSGFSRNAQITIVLIAFAVCNLLISLSSQYSILVLSRFLAGAMHGVYLAIAILLVTTITSEKNKPLSASLVMSGITLALVFGIPLSALIGKFLSWNLVFIAIMIISLLVMIGSFFVIPSIPKGPKPKLIEQFHILKTIPLIKAYLINIFVLAGIFNFVSYMSKTLEYHNLTVTSTSIALLIYGLACVIGNIFGGKLASKVGAIKSLTIVVGAELIFFGLFFFVNDSALIIWVTLLFMGLSAFAIVGPSQALVLKSSNAYLPNAVDSAMGLHISTIQIGIALGAVTGAFTISNWGILYTSVSSAILFLIAFLVIVSIRDSKIRNA